MFYEVQFVYYPSELLEMFVLSEAHKDNTTLGWRSVVILELTSLSPQQLLMLLFRLTQMFKELPYIPG